MPHMPPKGRIEWNLNTIVLIGVTATGICGSIFGWGVIYNKMNNNDEKAVASVAEVRQLFVEERTARKERGTLTDARFKVIEDKIPDIARLDDKITRLTELIAGVAKANEEVNKRIDRVVDSQNSKLDTIISRQSEQSADIKVIQSQLTRPNGNGAQRTRLPVMEPLFRGK